MEKHYREILLAVGIMVGLGLIWAFPWWAWGDRNPWNAPIPFFYRRSIVLLGVLYGALSRLPFPARMMVGWGILFFGQFVLMEMAMGVDRTFWVFGLILIAASSCLMFPGVALGAVLSASWRKIKKARSRTLGDSGL